MNNSIKGYVEKDLNISMKYNLSLTLKYIIFFINSPIKYYHCKFERTKYKINLLKKIKFISITLITT